MNGYILDTNCVSELVRQRPEPRVVQWIEGIPEEALFLSVVTVGEIRQGVSGLARGRRRTHLENWLVDLRLRFAGRILPVDETVADRWGELAAAGIAGGARLPVIDGLLAATALTFNLAVVSRDSKVYARAGVAVLNPWVD